MSSTESSAAWSEGKASSPLSRQFAIITDQGRNSAVIRKMDNGREPGVVVRELWIAREPRPREFLTDADFQAAVKAAKLPAMAIETTRRSVAATMNMMN